MAVFLNKEPRTRQISPVTSSPRIEDEHRQILVDMTKPMLDSVGLALMTLGDRPQPRQAIAMIRQLSAQWDRVFDFPAQSIGTRWAEQVSYAAKEKLEDAIAKALHREIYIVDDPEIWDSIALSAEESSLLIKTIPKDHLGKTAQAFVKAARGESFPENRTLAEEIQEINKIAIERAELIARDQTSKMNTAINQIRQTSLGIFEYLWRTREDKRVVGDPSGLYPKGNQVHGNHYIRNDLIFRWDEPPADGHPGYAINCRCKAIPRININDIRWSNGGYRQR